MATAYYIPNGPKNLSLLFPSVNFDEVEKYYIQVKDVNDEVVATGAINEIGGCCNDLKLRIHFLNKLGAIDAINFVLVQAEHETDSDEFERPLQAGDDKTKFQQGRFNVKSNDTFLVSSVEYLEQDLEWLTELADSPVAWIEWTGTQGQDDSYIPIIVLDSKIIKQKYEERHTYLVQISFRLSHQKFSIRN